MFHFGIRGEELNSLCAEQNVKTTASTIRVYINVTQKSVSVRLTD
jgi:hypothetical protein